MLTGIAAAVARTIQQKSMHPDENLIDLLVRLFSKPARIELEPVITNDIVVEKPKTNSSTKRLLSAVLQPQQSLRQSLHLLARGKGVGTLLIRTSSASGRSVTATKGVKQGDAADDAKCDQLAAEDVAEHNAGIRQCITREMAPNQEIALTSLHSMSV